PRRLGGIRIERKVSGKKRGVAGRQVLQTNGQAVDGRSRPLGGVIRLDAEEVVGRCIGDKDGGYLWSFVVDQDVQGRADRAGVAGEVFELCGDKVRSRGGNQRLGGDLPYTQAVVGVAVSVIGSDGSLADNFAVGINDNVGVGLAGSL